MITKARNLSQRQRSEERREGNDLYNEMKESGVIDKTALVYGQMNEPPGARMLSLIHI